jgi:trehalose 6-phosphate phosphatase
MAILEMMVAAETGPGRGLGVLEPISRDPGHSAILVDVDGTIAPIVDRPDGATVPEPTRELLRRLAARYGLVAGVSGRPALDARKVVGLEEIAYSGNHGFELLLPGESEPHPDPSLDGHDEDARHFVAGLDGRDLERVGIRIEDKGAIVALHWRGSDNVGEAESLAREIEAAADWKGLVAHRGRKVLEIRPDVAINKGIAVAALIPARPVSAALYAGDDLTDVDAFTALRTLHADGVLEDVVCVAVDSDEAPPEVAANADLSVAGPEGFVEVLEALAG